MDGERISLDASVAANVAAGDVFAARARAMVDDIVRRRGLDAPPAEPDDAGAPVELNPPMGLDLRADEIASVVWCTGFIGDFSWLDPPFSTRRPARHEDAAAPAPGVWYVGLRWLIRRGLRGGTAEGPSAVIARVIPAVESFARRLTPSMPARMRTRTRHRLRARLPVAGACIVALAAVGLMAWVRCLGPCGRCRRMGHLDDLN